MKYSSDSLQKKGNKKMKIKTVDLTITSRLD